MVWDGAAERTARTMPAWQADAVRAAMLVPLALVLVPAVLLLGDTGLTQALPLMAFGGLLLAVLVASASTFVVQITLDPRGLRARRLLARPVTIARERVASVVMVESLVVRERGRDLLRRRLLVVDARGTALLVATWVRPGFDAAAFLAPWGMPVGVMTRPVRPDELERLVPGSATGFERPARAARVVAAVLGAVALVAALGAALALDLAG